MQGPRAASGRGEKPRAVGGRGSLIGYLHDGTVISPIIISTLLNLPFLTSPWRGNKLQHPVPIAHCVITTNVTSQEQPGAVPIS